MHRRTVCLGFSADPDDALALHANEQLIFSCSPVRQQTSSSGSVKSVGMALTSSNKKHALISGQCGKRTLIRILKGNSRRLATNCCSEIFEQFGSVWQASAEKGAIRHDVEITAR